jgi:hypothetical protein
MGETLAECEFMPGCPFFNDRIDDMPATASLIKTQYCSGSRASNRRCARFVVASRVGRKYCPEDLFPYDLQRAHEIVQQRSAS